jgi:hypothetical protein
MSVFKSAAISMLVLAAVAITRNLSRLRQNLHEWQEDPQSGSYARTGPVMSLESWRRLWAARNAQSNAAISAVRRAFVVAALLLAVLCAVTLLTFIK